MLFNKRVYLDHGMVWNPPNSSSPEGNPSESIPEREQWKQFLDHPSGPGPLKTDWEEGNLAHWHFVTSRGRAKPSPQKMLSWPPAAMDSSPLHQMTQI